jgi:hypothetical protein
MGCGCDMVNYIKKQRNIYYINSTLPASATGQWSIGFPSMPLNIKANNCLISIDKVTLSTSNDIANRYLFPVLFQTNIPSANCLSGNLDATSYQNPSTTGFAELIALQPTLLTNNADAAVDKPVLSSYVSNNNDRKVICTNPFGQNFNLILYNVRNGAGERNRLQVDPATGNVVPLATIGPLNITFRIELLEEET